MAEVRSGAVTLKGNSVDLAGPELKAGDAAPDFKLQNNALADVTLADSAGKKRIIITVPSLDTPTCHEETKRFNDEAGKLDGVEVLVVSMDLPFAQKRWCGAAGVEKVTTLSDHFNASFGTGYGVLIKELRLLDFEMTDDPVSQALDQFDVVNFDDLHASHDIVDVMSRWIAALKLGCQLILQNIRSLLHQ